jgi:hypothetical protein
MGPVVSVGDVKVLLAAVVFVIGGCGSCDDAGRGHPWDVSNPDGDTTADAMDVADDAVEYSDEDTSLDATDADETTDVVVDDSSSDDSESDVPDAEDPLACLEVDGAECPVQDPTSYGDCRMSLGVVFDGEDCVAASGCDCDGGGCPQFDSLTECARECSGASVCTEDDLPTYARDTEPVMCRFLHCGLELTFCVSSQSDPADQLGALFPNERVACEKDARNCTLAAALGGGTACEQGDWCCWIDGRLDVDSLRGACAASLLPGVQRGACYALE